MARKTKNTATVDAPTPTSTTPNNVVTSTALQGDSSYVVGEGGTTPQGNTGIAFNAPTSGALRGVRIDLNTIVWGMPGVPTDELTFKRRVWQLYKADNTLVSRIIHATRGLYGVNHHPVWVVKDTYRPFITDVLRKLIAYHNQQNQ